MSHSGKGDDSIRLEDDLTKRPTFLQVNHKF